MNLNTLALPELKKLSRQIDSEIAKRQSGVKRDFIKRMEKLAADHGFTLAEVIGAPTVKNATKKPQQAKQNGSKLPIKYWNPLNPKEGWSGHARRPGWFRNWVENGGDPEDLKRRRD